MKASLGKFVLPSAVAVALSLTMAAHALEVGNFRDVIVYYNPERPPVIEWHHQNADKHWELVAVYFDSDGDWALDSVLGYTGKKWIEQEYFPGSKNKQHLYAKADSAEAFEKDKTFGLDLTAGERLFQPPRPEASINIERRRSKEYKALLTRLAAVKLAPRPRPQRISFNGTVESK